MLKLFMFMCHDHTRMLKSIQRFNANINGRTGLQIDVFNNYFTKSQSLEGCFERLTAVDLSVIQAAFKDYETAFFAWKNRQISALLSTDSCQLSLRPDAPTRLPVTPKLAGDSWSDVIAVVNSKTGSGILKAIADREKTIDVRAHSRRRAHLARNSKSSSFEKAT